MNDQQRYPRPGVPERVAHLMDEPGLAAARERIVNTNRDTAETIELLLNYREDRQREVAGDHIHFRAATTRDANRHAALLLETTEQTATAILSAAEYVREHLPKFWKAFRRGAIDLAKLRKTAVETTPLIHREDLLEIIDDELVDIAPGKTPTELKAWITRRIPQLTLSCSMRQLQKPKIAVTSVSTTVKRE